MLALVFVVVLLGIVAAHAISELGLGFDAFYALISIELTIIWAITY